MYNRFVYFFGCILIFFILTVSCSKKADDALLPFNMNNLSDKEDNDVKKSPSEVTTQEPIVGFFHNKDDVGDKDYFKVYFTHKDTSYKIVQTAVPGIDAKISFFSPDGNRLFYVDEGKTGEAEKLWEYYPKTDHFLMLVESKTGYNEVVPYVINFIPKVSDGINEVEPNNTRRNSVIIGMNDEKKGLIAPKSDVDYYRIIFPDESNYDFTISIETLSNLDINFTLYNTIQDKVKFVNSFSWGQKESFPFLSSSKGEYYIKVSGNIQNKSRKNPVYYLTVHEDNNVKTDVYYEREYNDSAEFATELIDSAELIGVFYPKNDDDWYEFDLFKDRGDINVSLSRVRGLNTVIELYDANLKLLKKVDESGVDGPEKFVLKKQDKGRYYLKISSEEKSLLEYRLFLDIIY